MSKKSKAQGKCIFCGGEGLTKEHVWPNWIKSVLPRDSTEHHTQYTLGITALPMNPVLIQPNIQFSLIDTLQQFRLRIDKS